MYRLSAEQSALIARSRDLAGNQIAPHADRVDETSAFPLESVQALGEAGLLGLTIPPAYGGMGHGPRVACAVLEEVAHRCASTAMVYMMHLCGVACYLAAPKKPGTQLGDAAAGRHLSTLAFSERGSRSHCWAPVSRAGRPDQNGKVLLSADKSFVTSAGYANGYAVSTGWDGATEPMQSMVYLVLGSDPGVSVSGKWSALGMRGNHSAPMRLERVLIDEQTRALCEAGKGFETLMGVVLPLFNLCQAAIALGICEAAIEATQTHLTCSKLEHLQIRLCDLPNLRAQLARMRVMTDRARAHLVSTLDAVEAARADAETLVLEIKASATETAIEVTDLAMRSCGGAAFSRQLGIERRFRDARAGVVMTPTTDQAYDSLGRALCGMSLF
jgi:alkylation response protein AidB-like acyl-CoA dehydrogenase